MTEREKTKVEEKKGNWTMQSCKSMEGLWGKKGQCFSSQPREKKQGVGKSAGAQGQQPNSTS